MSGRNELRKTPPLCYNSAKSDVLITNAAESAEVRPNTNLYEEGVPKGGKRTGASHSPYASLRWGQADRDKPQSLRVPTVSAGWYKIVTHDEGDWNVYREDCKIGLAY